MSKSYDFLKECGTFFISTINEGYPATRPFGAVMELNDELYISTANTKDVYSQLIKNPLIHIVALKSGTRDWIRINGKAIEIHDLDIKQMMLDACPVLTKRFDSKSCEHFALFKISEMVSALNSGGVFVDLTQRPVARF